MFALAEHRHSNSFDLCSSIKIHMENNNNSDSVSNLRDQQIGLDPDLSEGDSFTTVIVTLT